MPTIDVSRRVLEKLARQKITEQGLERVKGEIDSESNGIIKLEVEDTNRPDLWSVEGVARVFREKGIPKLKVKKSGKKIKVDKNIEKIRPFIAGFIAKKIVITSELLEDLIQMQEKTTENFGRKRKKISIGIYNYKDTKFPVQYKAISPKGIKFAPLDFKEEMDLDEILERHPKGHEYGHIVKNHKLYPIFMDKKDQVLSFPPIINSNYLGRVEEGMNEVFIEVTGDDIRSVNLIVNIFALALQDRGAKIQSVEVNYPYKTSFGKKMNTPFIETEEIIFPEELVEKRLGLSLKTTKLIKLLRSMQYNTKKKGKNLHVTIPYYRRDIMHPFDVIEDVAIAYGYSNIEPIEVTSYTAGELSGTSELVEKIKRNVVGLGFQEIMSPILSNRKDLHEKTLSTNKLIEIDNQMSETYSAVRDSVLSSLLNIISKNSHVEYPQKIFEVGECSYVEKSDIINITKLAACTSDTTAGYEDIVSVVDALFRLIGVNYKLKPSKSMTFINGRQAIITVNGKEIGIVGEVSLDVLEKWGIEMPVSALEIDIGPLL
jgi:phenylalanyl-tRNA synthetase beta chain